MRDYKDAAVVLSITVLTVVLLTGSVLITVFGYLDRISVGYFLLGGITVAGVILMYTLLRSLKCRFFSQKILKISIGLKK